MVLRRTGDAPGAIAIGQPSHAWLSGQLARAWRGPVAEVVCLAAEQHDIGMAEWDLRPALNRDTGLPQSFMEMELDVHLELWSAAASRLLRQSTYAALLVSMHGTALYEMRDLDRMEPADADKVRAFIADRRAEQDALLAALGRSRDDVRADQRLIWTWDWMSLALCLDWAPAEGPDGLRLTVAADGRVAVDPWPFVRDSVTVRCEGRRLAGGYTDEQEMHAALEGAAPEPIVWGLVRA